MLKFHWGFNHHLKADSTNLQDDQGTTFRYILHGNYYLNYLEHKAWLCVRWFWSSSDYLQEEIQCCLERDDTWSPLWKTGWTLCNSLILYLSLLVPLPVFFFSPFGSVFLYSCSYYIGFLLFNIKSVGASFLLFLIKNELCLRRLRASPSDC
jgi:hypothetical protein